MSIRIASEIEKRMLDESVKETAWDELNQTYLGLVEHEHCHLIGSQKSKKKMTKDSCIQLD